MIDSHKTAQKLLDRIRQIKLHAHAYGFISHLKHGNSDVIDLLNFASKEGLNGVDINIGYGNGNSLKNKSTEKLEEVSRHAKKLGLEIDLDVSSSEEAEVDRAIEIAKIFGTRRIRIYVRHGGRLSEIIDKATKDLKSVAKKAEINNLEFFLEQHEVMQSHELVKVVQAINSPRVNMLFDFGNMINANEQPLDALKNMAPYAQKVHIKDVHRRRKGEGYEQTGAIHGEGDIPIMEMMLELLLLGESKPQVQIYSLEHVMGYTSPPFRFDGEDKDPLIPDRAISKTLLNDSLDLKENLNLEIKNFRHQVKYIKNLLNQLKTLAEEKLNSRLSR